MIRARRAGRADIMQFENSVKKLFDKLQGDTLQLVKGNTPIRSGRARNAWTGQSTATGFEVENSVPYIEQLEAGRSKQAPRGIIGPTTRSVRRKIAQTGRLQSGRLTR